MGKLKEYMEQPVVEIGGRKFIDEKLLLDFLDERFCDVRNECETQDEKDGIDMCRNILANW